MLILNLLRVRLSLKSWGRFLLLHFKQDQDCWSEPAATRKEQKTAGDNLRCSRREHWRENRVSVQEEAQGDSDSRSRPALSPLLFPRPPHATRGTCHPPRSRGIRSVRIPSAAHALAALRPLRYLQRRLGRAGQRRSPGKLRQ